MNFQNLPTVPTADQCLDVAFHSASDAVSSSRGHSGGKGSNRLLKSRNLENQRVGMATKMLCRALERITETFPNLERLPPFYNALVKATLDYGILRQSLGAVSWAESRVQALSRAAVGNIRRAQDLRAVNPIRREFYGRASSVIKQIKDNLIYLSQCRKVLKRYPDIKIGMPTVVIAGYPNVGKSTLLRALTGSSPAIAPYPFTTQQLMVGYYTDSYSNQYQIIDTPGLLDRPLEERNPSEVQAILALKYLAHAMVFLIDPTQSSGYSVPEQQQLLKSVRSQFDMPVIIVINKEDMDGVTARQTATALKALAISADKSTGIAELKVVIGKSAKLPEVIVEKKSPENERARASDCE